MKKIEGELDFMRLSLNVEGGRPSGVEYSYDQPTYSFHNYGATYTLRLFRKGEGDADPVVGLVFTDQDFIQFIMNAEMALRDVEMLG